MDELGQFRGIILYKTYENIRKARKVCKGIRASYLWTLGIIGHHEGLGMTALSRTVNVKPHAMNSRLRYVVELGLAYKVSGKLYLTDKGREVFEILEKGFAEGLDLFLKAALKEHLKRSGGLVAEDGQEYKRKKPRPE